MNEPIDEITAAVASAFRCFGGGQGTSGNPIAAELADQPPQFAAGVDVRQVAAYVTKCQNHFIAGGKTLFGVEITDGKPRPVLLVTPDAVD